MIARLNGTIVEQTSDSVVLDVTGVGYEVFCSAFTLTAISRPQFANGETALATTAGSEAEALTSLWIHTVVREDALTLYGFATRSEKAVFEALLRVSGIGPKLAQKILSAISASELVAYIESRNSQALSAIPKVGRKTAEQIILTLQGKLQAIGSLEGHAKMSDVRGEITSALINLGYRSQEVEKVVASLGEVDLQSGIRQGLQRLSPPKRAENL